MKTDRRQLWLGLALAIAAIVLMETRCKGGVVTESFINRVAWRESNNNPSAMGKAGEVGLMQIRKVALKDVNAKHGTKYAMRDLLNPTINRWVGARYLEIQEQRLAKKLRRQPTEVEVYRAYNWGFRGSFRK